MLQNEADCLENTCTVRSELQQTLYCRHHVVVVCLYAQHGVITNRLNFFWSANVFGQDFCEQDGPFLQK